MSASRYRSGFLFVVAISAFACSEAVRNSPGGMGGASGSRPDSANGGGASGARTSASVGSRSPSSGDRGSNRGGDSSDESSSNPGGGAAREGGGARNSNGGTTRDSGTTTALGGASALGGSTAIGGTTAGAGKTNDAGGSASGGTKATGGAAAGAGGTKNVGGRATATGGTSAGGGGASGTGGTSVSTSAGGTAVTGIKISGRQLLVNGKPFRIRGVCWNPVPKGKNHPEGIDYPGLASKDIPLMKAANINVVRTYEPLTNTAVLGQLADAGIYVLNSVYPYGGSPATDVTARVNAVKSHRAILMWVIGNEWNYNGLYVNMSATDSQARLNEVAALIRAADPNHPIASVYGDLPPKAVVDAMPNIDAWGVNVYSGISFGDRFTKWPTISSKPLFVSEYGADAYNATTNAYDPDNQAKATDALTREIAAQCSDTNANGVALGGTIFEWADEWWKASGDVNAHDTGGLEGEGGPYPDSVFNEEWWGIVDIDRNTRPAYDALKTVYGDG